MSTAKHLVIMAAGTGGHIIPGLAVATEMKRRGWTVSWIGTPNGMESTMVPKAGIELDPVPFTGMRGKGLTHTVKGTLQIVPSVLKSIKFLRSRKATAVVGMGGYVCLPGGVAASLIRKPLVLVNADASLLKSTQALLRFADRVAFGFDGKATKAVKNSVVTGNPVRAEIANLPAPAERFAGRNGPLRVLVVGGSLGAQVLNQNVPKALALLSADERPVVVHQSGAANLAVVQAQYGESQVEAEIVPFVEDMAAQLAACDLIICRSGAITVSELCAAGVPSILVPLVISTTAHQRDNATWLSDNGGAVHLPQTELTPQKLADLIRGLDRPRLVEMAEKARQLRIDNAAGKVADLIEELS